MPRPGASTGRPFSPDGHLVGSLGEVLAADLLDLTLMPPSNDGYDAIDNEGRKVEIKATTCRSVSLSASGTRVERLVVVVLDRYGHASIVYDGLRCRLGRRGKPQKNGQRANSASYDLGSSNRAQAPSRRTETGAPQNAYSPGASEGVTKRRLKVALLIGPT